MNWAEAQVASQFPQIPSSPALQVHNTASSLLCLSNDISASAFTSFAPTNYPHLQLSQALASAGETPSLSSLCALIKSHVTSMCLWAGASAAILSAWLKCSAQRLDAGTSFSIVQSRMGTEKGWFLNIQTGGEEDVARVRIRLMGYGAVNHPERLWKWPSVSALKHKARLLTETSPNHLVYKD